MIEPLKGGAINMAMVGHLPSWPILDCECSIKPFFKPPCDKEEHIYAGKHKSSLCFAVISEKKRCQIIKFNQMDSCAFFEKFTTAAPNFSLSSNNSARIETENFA